jgi:uncharacterized spore protein YtfJ
MSSPAPFEPIAELLERSLSIRHVYGEPVQRGDTTVIPVAQVVYGFGAGGGRGPGRTRTIGPGERAPDEDGRPEAQGAGGGGGVRMTPVGAVEIGPQGTPLHSFSSAGSVGTWGSAWAGRGLARCPAPSLKTGCLARQPV